MDPTGGNEYYGFRVAVSPPTRRPESMRLNGVRSLSKEKRYLTPFPFSRLELLSMRFLFVAKQECSSMPSAHAEGIDLLF